MARGPLFKDGYRPQLSGHETFPLRYGWLKKAFDAVEESKDGREVFLAESAIARFGVGKNMVASIRHWAVAADILDDSEGLEKIRPTTLGRKLFGRDGRDPYMEHPTTLWLVHWKLAARADKTTWFWAFNHYPAVTFHRDQLIQGITRLAQDRAWPRAAPATIKNDVACFIRTYATQSPSKRIGNEDALEAPLSELGLIKPIDKRDEFRFVRGPKATLTCGLFTYALINFWLHSSPTTATLSLEAIAHAPGSPGRVFLLEENDVADHLAQLSEVTKGKLSWSETVGLNQVVRDGDLDTDLAFSYVDIDYGRPLSRRRAI